MSRYDYQCETCNQVFEVRASIQEKEAGLKPVCPNCHGTIAHQVIRVSFVLHTTSGAGNQNFCRGPNVKPGCCG